MLPAAFSAPWTDRDYNAVTPDGQVGPIWDHTNDRISVWLLTCTDQALLAGGTQPPNHRCGGTPTNLIDVPRDSHHRHGVTASLWCLRWRVAAALRTGCRLLLPAIGRGSRCTENDLAGGHRSGDLGVAHTDHDRRTRVRSHGHG